MTILRIKKKEFDLIRSGVKKREFRCVSQFLGINRNKW